MERGDHTRISEVYNGYVTIALRTGWMDDVTSGRSSSPLVGILEARSVPQQHSVDADVRLDALLALLGGERHLVVGCYGHVGVIT